MSIKIDNLANLRSVIEQLEGCIRERDALLAKLICHPDPTGTMREPPHCPSCSCGIPVPQHWSEYVAQRDELYALRGEILEARRVGRPPEAFWLAYQEKS